MLCLGRASRTRIAERSAVGVTASLVLSTGCEAHGLERSPPVLSQGSGFAAQVPKSSQAQVARRCGPKGGSPHRQEQEQPRARSGRCAPPSAPACVSSAPQRSPLLPGFLA